MLKMNRIILSLSLVLAVMVLASSVWAVDQKKVQLRVDGLSCPFCAYGLEKKLKRIKGVDKLEIKINEGLVIMTFKEKANIDPELIRKKVKEAGFTPRELSIEGKAVTVKSAPQGEKIVLNIQGMTCNDCVARVSRALTAVECVKDVKVDLKKGQATFVCTNPKFDKAKLVKTVEDLGFKAKLVKP